jgi:hypothetical protein
MVPDKGFRVLIVDVDIVADSHDQLFQILEDSAPDAVMHDVAEETFHHVEP